MLNSALRNGLPLVLLLFGYYNSVVGFVVPSCNANSNPFNFSKIKRNIHLFLQRQQPFLLVRGDAYGKSNNSTIPSATDVAAAVGVVPPELNASIRKWKWAYAFQKYMTPMLHIFDKQKPPNSSLNIYCLWWKALSGNDKKSPVYDNGLSYDLLPRGTRRIIKWFHRYFPRLHHANVEIRTAYLDQAITRCVTHQRTRNTNNIRIRLISFGAGYDIRSIKLKERGMIDEAIELDLPSVIDAKERLLSSNRFQQRRQQTYHDSLPKQYYRVDLNNITHVQSILNEICNTKQPLSSSSNDIWYTIYVFEAVFIYLHDGIPHTLLHVCSQTLHKYRMMGSICFADRLENVPGGNYTMAINEMKSTGWELQEWLPKPGLARHMGSATLLL